MEYAESVPGTEGSTIGYDNGQWISQGASSSTVSPPTLEKRLFPAHRDLDVPQISLLDDPSDNEPGHDNQASCSQAAGRRLGASRRPALGEARETSARKGSPAQAQHNPGLLRTTSPPPLQYPRSPALMAARAKSQSNLLDAADKAKSNMQQNIQRVQDFGRVLEELRKEADDWKKEANGWKRQYEAAKAAADEKEAENVRLAEQLQVQCATTHEAVILELTEEVDQLRLDLGRAQQRIWELEYEVEDSREEIKTLNKRLRHSITVRFQGESADDEDEEGSVRAGFVTKLAWEEHENAKIKALKSHIKALRRDKGKARQ